MLRRHHFATQSMGRTPGAAQIGWNCLYSRYPEAIVFCVNTQDVVNAVEWARGQGIALRARENLMGVDQRVVDGVRAAIEGG